MCLWTGITSSKLGCWGQTLPLWPIPVAPAHQHPKAGSLAGLSLGKVTILALGVITKPSREQVLREELFQLQELLWVSIPVGKDMGLSSLNLYHPFPPGVEQTL